MSEGLAMGLAIRNHEHAILGQLLEAKADPNQSLYVFTVLPPLQLAVVYGNLQAARLLVGAGADICKSASPVNLVNYACGCYQYDMATYLFEHGAPFALMPGDIHSSIMSRFERRISNCRRCAATLLCAPFRAGLKLPRDVATLLARAVWLHRRRDVWE